jgi:hypothetical protein
VGDKWVRKQERILSNLCHASVNCYRNEIKTLHSLTSTFREATLHLVHPSKLQLHMRCVRPCLHGVLSILFLVSQGERKQKTWP